MGSFSDERPNFAEALTHLLAILAVYWKAFLIGYVGLAAAGVAIALLTSHPQYSSRMVLPLAPTARALIKTEAILDPVALEAHMAAELSNLPNARGELADKIVVSPELAPGSGIYSVTVTDQAPQRAQEILQVLLAHVLATSKPTGSVRIALLQEIETLKNALADLKKLAQALSGNANRVKGGDEGEQYARAFVSLVSEIAAKENRIAELERGLEGLKPDDVLLRPTLANQPDRANLRAKIGLAVSCSFLLMFGAILLRHQWLQRSSSFAEDINRSHFRRPNLAPRA
ncbi:hypothetical protein [Bradyrhizobium sp. DASA03120]|uniref:hypothetical protein n=1 Tax=Bradyrhizobium sp. SMVTL-02 TaxID=3395917 RepID=UPI003F729BCC